MDHVILMAAMVAVHQLFADGALFFDDILTKFEGRMEKKRKHE
jgi:hypothetical protein